MNLFTALFDWIGVGGPLGIFDRLLLAGAARDVDFYGQTVDYYEDGEDGSLAAGFTETDTGGDLTLGDSAQYAAGAASVSVVIDGSSTTTMLYASPGAASVSFGFWIRTGNWGTFDGGHDLVRFYGDVPGYANPLVEGSNDGSPRGIWQGGAAGTASLTASTWYWVTGQFNNGATSYWRVYDTSHNQVGAEKTWTAFSYNLAKIEFGNPNGGTIGSGNTIYLDDIVVDLDGGVYPILGWSAGGGSYTVTYDGNTNTGGTAPTDGASPYSSGITVTVLANTGSLIKTGYTFTGWNTAANGSGTGYNASGTATFTMPAANVTLYAQWSLNEAGPTTYYVDFDAGSDAAAGTSTGAPWKHCPGDANATGTAASTTLAAGDTVIFNRGVTYVGQIAPGQSGSQRVARSTASITSGGVLTDAGATFETANVGVGNQVYIYHSKASVTGTWVESVGLFTVASVDSETQITLSDFDGVAHTTAEMTYVISLPITYKSDPSWGTGAATIDGGSSRTYGIGSYPDNSRHYLRIESLTFANHASTQNWHSAVSMGSGSQHIYVVGCTFTSNAGNVIWAGNYAISKNNTATAGATAPHMMLAPDYNGTGQEVYQLVEGNTVSGGYRTVANGSYQVVRYNNIGSVIGDVDHHADGFGPIDKWSYSWIYGNLVDDTVEFIALYGGSAGAVTDLVIHSNVFICRYETSGHGDNVILGRDGTRVYFLNNTAVGPSVNALADAFIQMGQDGYDAAVDWVIKNNIFVTETSTLLKIGSGGATNATIDYNHYVGTQFYQGGATKTYAQWQALGYDANSIADLTTDPVFVDASYATPDLQLQSGSPDIGIGENLSTMFTRDYNGVARHGVDAWTLGAYTYLGVTPYPVTYSANNATSGTAPTDGSSPYTEGQTVTVLDNTGTLAKTAYTWTGWNTLANGTGIHRAASSTFSMPGEDVVLYAEWTPIDYNVTYDGNTADSGSVPTDATDYNIGDTVTTAGNTGVLVKAGYVFAGWNTQADGGGTTRGVGSTWAMGAGNVTLYARWTVPTVGGSSFAIAMGMFGLSCLLIGFALGLGWATHRQKAAIALTRAEVLADLADPEQAKARAELDYWLTHPGDRPGEGA